MGGRAKGVRSYSGEGRRSSEGSEEKMRRGHTSHCTAVKDSRNAWTLCIHTQLQRLTLAAVKVA